jgi:very-short-patch-repair endonuclease
MRHVFNDASLGLRRKGLRQKMPQPEIVIWSKLRNRQICGYKFKRQFSVSGYILDFYCPSARLAIEIDGDSHSTEKSKQYDDERTQILGSLNHESGD